MHKSARQKYAFCRVRTLNLTHITNYSGATLPVHHLVRIDIWPHILAVIVSGQSQRVNPDFGPHLSGLEHSLTAKISKICPDWKTSFGCIFRGPFPTRWPSNIPAFLKISWRPSWTRGELVESWNVSSGLARACSRPVFQKFHLMCRRGQKRKL